VVNPTILVATWSDGLFAVKGEGGLAQELTDQPVRGLASDGRGGALVVAGRHKVLRRCADRSEWVAIAIADEHDLSCCIAVRETVYAGTDDARLLQLSDIEGGVLAPLEGFDHVSGRETWFAGSAIVNGQRVGPPLGIRSIAANSNGSVLFANVHVGGIPRSLDGGRTWQPTIDINCDVHEVRGHPMHPEVIAAASGVGLCISRDGGETWSIEREGLHAPYCSAVAFSGEVILVSSATDPFAAEGRVYRRPVEGRDALIPVEGEILAWTKGSIDTGCIAVNGPSIAMADRAGDLYTSDDFGQTWSARSTGLPSPSGVLILS
jgi:hypothetical protein